LLDGVVDAYLRTLSELDFFDPFQAILGANGFYDIHRTHGTAEFGRDFIAKRLEDGVIWQYGIQTKVGNVGQGEYRRDVLGQIEEVRLLTGMNPNFDAGLPRKAVLATTGRLIGNAPSAAQNYKLQHDTDRFRFEVWTIDSLLELTANAPEAALAGPMENHVLGAVATIHVGKFTETSLYDLSNEWITDGPDELWRSALIALVISGRLKSAGRTDLAALAGVHLVRAAWASVHGHEPVPQKAIDVARAGQAILRANAIALLEEFHSLPAGPRGFVWSTQDVGAFVNYPIRCLRLLELFGLTGLAESDANTRDSLMNACRTLISDHPGSSHPPSDNWAVSLLAPAIFVALEDPELVGHWLLQVCRWVADRYDPSTGLGLAAVFSEPNEEVQQLLSPPYDFIDVLPRQESLIATVLLDLAAALELSAAYDDIINEILAVGVFTPVVECDDDLAQYCETGRGGVRFEPGMQYDGYYATSSGWTSAPHHKRHTPHYLERHGYFWDFLSLCTVMRNRSFPTAIRKLTGRSMAVDPPTDAPE
jgi:hypothetical protein